MLIDDHKLPNKPGIINRAFLIGETMTAKELLTRPAAIAQEIADLQEELQEITYKLIDAQHPAPGMSKVRTSPRFDRIPQLVQRKEGIKQSIQAKQVYLVLIKAKTANKITELEDPRYMRILYRHYVKGETLEAVAAALDYDPSHICKLKREAMAALEDLLK